MSRLSKRSSVAKVSMSGIIGPKGIVLAIIRLLSKLHTKLLKLLGKGKRGEGKEYTVALSHYLTTILYQEP